MCTKQTVGQKGVYFSAPRVLSKLEIKGCYEPSSRLPACFLSRGEH